MLIGGTGRVEKLVTCGLLDAYGRVGDLAARLPPEYM